MWNALAIKRYMWTNILGQSTICKHCLKRLLLRSHWMLRCKRHHLKEAQLKLLLQIITLSCGTMGIAQRQLLVCLCIVDIVSIQLAKLMSDVGFN